MDKEVILALKGLQFGLEGEDGEALETITPASYYKRNDSHYVIYDELVEGFPTKTQNIIKFKDSLLEVTKNGLINVHMVFEENKKNMTSYTTPYGNIMIGVDTEAVEIAEENNHIKVNVEYRLEANYEYLADCRIEMDIKGRRAGFEL